MDSPVLPIPTVSCCISLPIPPASGLEILSLISACHSWWKKILNAHPPDDFPFVIAQDPFRTLVKDDDSAKGIMSDDTLIGGLYHFCFERDAYAQPHRSEPALPSGA